MSTIALRAVVAPVSGTTNSVFRKLPTENINILKQHVMSNQTKKDDPESAKIFYVTFSESGLITISPDKPQKGSNTDLAIQKDGTLSLTAGNNMPLNFYEQVEDLNWLLANLKK